MFYDTISVGRCYIYIYNERAENWSTNIIRRYIADYFKRGVGTFDRPVPGQPFFDFRVDSNNVRTYTRRYVLHNDYRRRIYIYIFYGDDCRIV